MIAKCSPFSFLWDFYSVCFLMKKNSQRWICMFKRRVFQLKANEKSYSTPQSQWSLRRCGVPGENKQYYILCSVKCQETTDSWKSWNMTVVQKNKERKKHIVSCLEFSMSSFSLLSRTHTCQVSHFIRETHGLSKLFMSHVRDTECHTQ